MLTLARADLGLVGRGEMLKMEIDTKEPVIHNGVVVDLILQAIIHLSASKIGTCETASGI